MTQVPRAALRVAVLALAVVGAAGAADLPMVSVDDVEKMLGAPDVRIYDANTREVFEKAHLPGAIFVDARSLAATLPQDKSLRLVFYCKNPH
jgi:3-mercaptopyruvate sulfurtransferase SseA